MRTAPFVLTLVLACSSTGPDQSAVWGSNDAALTITESDATLRILASGGCYGSYGVIDHLVPSGSSSASGTYGQLTGVAPGHVDYPAQYTITVVGGEMTLSIGIPALQQTLGPFQLRQGVVRSWPACMYP
jgi:hypothetical protein